MSYKQCKTVDDVEGGEENEGIYKHDLISLSTLSKSNLKIFEDRFCRTTKKFLVASTGIHCYSIMIILKE